MRHYWTWLAATGATTLGTQTLIFGLVWHAALIGPGTAAAVLFAQILPRALLTLHGGALSDRVGALRVMAIANTILCLLAALGAMAMSMAAPTPAAMVITALALGTVDAINIPAAASVPKLLVPAPAMGRAMAARNIVLQAGALCGPPLAGTTLTLVGLPATYATGAVGYLVMLLVLRSLRPRTRTTPRTGAPTGLNRQVAQGVALVWTTPLLRVTVLLTGAFAMFAIPFPSLLLPLVFTDRGLDAVVAGTAAGAFGTGMALMSALVLWRGTAPRSGPVACAGMITAGAGIAITATVDGALPLCLMSLVIGLGTGVFSTHLGPLVMNACPPQAVGRVQAVVTLAQWVPLLWANPAIGVLAQTWPMTVLVLLWGGGAATTGLVALCSRSLRTATAPHPVRSDR